MASYALVLLLTVRRATARGVALPTWIWAFTVVLECSFPTAAIAILQNNPLISPLQPLTGPISFVYGAMITLSILRMRAWLCMLGGITAAVGHAALFFRAVSGAHPVEPGEYAYYLSYPVDLCITGAAAAMVATAVRGFFLSSLREAAAKRELEHVHHELDLARSIQMGLLPTEAPNAPGFDIAGWSRPAEQTGGDYYDWQSLPDGRILISVADATGHGIGPAMVSAVCRAYARAVAEGNGGTGLLAQRLNKLLTADLPAGKFVTYAGLLLRPSLAGEAELISAGHGPLFLHRGAKDGNPAKWDGGEDGLDTHGPPFAVDGDYSFNPPTQIIFRPGDVIVIPTDGAFEWLDKSNNQFGIDRLKAVIGAHADKSARQIIDAIDESLRDFSLGTVQQDDVTVIVIKCIATESSLSRHADNKSE